MTKNQIKAKIIKILSKLKIIDPFAHVSYSQCGEDLIIDNVFKQLHIKKIKYLDIGAHHPINISNTYYFYKKGNSGVEIDPDISVFKELEDVRKRDICLNIGIGLKNEMADYFVMSTRALNTFSKEEAERVSKNGTQKIVKVLKMPLKPVNEIISKYFDGGYPNFVSLDIEGMDYAILQSFDFSKYKPEVFCVETITYTEDNKEKKIPEISELMEKNGYFIYADTYINTIFVNKTSWEKSREK